MRALRSVLLLCLAAASADAQATLGSAAVGGTVRDPTGAAVPEARIALTETARGLVRETVSNSAGSYLFPSVSAGVYSLRVSKEAFEAYELKDVHLDIGGKAGPARDRVERHRHGGRFGEGGKPAAQWTKLFAAGADRRIE